MRAFRPRVITGLDVGSSAVKAVRLVREGTTHRAVNWAVRERPPARREEDPDLLREIVREGRRWLIETLLRIVQAVRG